MKRLSAVAVLVAGCTLTPSSGSSTSAVTPPSSTTSAPLVTTSAIPPRPLVVPESLEGFGTTTITIDDVAYVVAVADDAAERAQGLMNVTDLLDLDGMLFVFPSDGRSEFWMKDTSMPLDIAFFDADGVFMERLTMSPCTQDPCPSYTPARPYRTALEAPAGVLTWLSGGEVLAVHE